MEKPTPSNAPSVPSLVTDRQQVNATTASPVVAAPNQETNPLPQNQEKRMLRSIIILFYNCKIIILFLDVEEHKDEAEVGGVVDYTKIPAQLEQRYFVYFYFVIIYWVFNVSKDSKNSTKAMPSILPSSTPVILGTKLSSSLSFLNPRRKLLTLRNKEKRRTKHLIYSMPSPSQEHSLSTMLPSTSSSLPLIVSISRLSILLFRTT